ncbi:OmpH family outer membrane protein, partial [candidate division KSB1 bacterium]
MNYSDSISLRNNIKTKLIPIIIVGLVFLLSSLPADAQKYGYVDTDYILENIPEYTDAQEELNELSVKWQKEIEEKFTKIDKMYKDYQAEIVLLPEDIKQKREDEIIKAEKDAKEIQKKRFGKEGDLFKRRQELIKPIQDKIYNAIEDIATTRNYVFVFDKAGSLSLLYANPKYDISDDILEKLGYNIGS